MTTPPAQDVRALCDRLEQAHAAIGDSPAFRVVGYVRDDEQVFAEYDDGGQSLFADCYGTDAAALIVAAVNHLPSLVSAVRAVADLADELGTPATALSGPGYRKGWNAAEATVAARLSALLAMIEGGPTT